MPTVETPRWRKCGSSASEDLARDPRVAVGGVAADHGDAELRGDELELGLSPPRGVERDGEPSGVEREDFRHRQPPPAARSGQHGHVEGHVVSDQDPTGAGRVEPGQHLAERGGAGDLRRR